MEELPKVTESNGIINAYQLNNFYLEATKVLQRLGQLGLTGVDNHLRWNTILSARLPQVMAIEWAKKYKDWQADPVGSDPINKFMLFVREQNETVRLVTNNYKIGRSDTEKKNGAKPEQKKKQEDKNARPEQNYATTTHKGNTPQKKQAPKASSAKANTGGATASKPQETKQHVSKDPGYCYLCSTEDNQNKHHPSQCKKPGKDAYQKLYEIGGCTSCGNLSHTPKDCKTRKPCTQKKEDGSPCPYFHMSSLHSIPYVGYRKFKQGKK